MVLTAAGVLWGPRSTTHLLKVFCCGVLIRFYILLSVFVEQANLFIQFFEFILVLLFSTGLAFQLPVIQVVLGSLKIFSSRLMFSVWRYVILGSTIIGAILTPSVDPVTQIFMSSIIMVLYFGGAGLVYLIERSQSDTQTA